MKSIARFFVGALLIGAFIIPQVSSATTTEELQAQINALLEQIAALQAQLAQTTQTTTTTPPPTNWCYDFSAAPDMRGGDSGAHVTALQTALVQEGFSVEIAGYFGPKTFAAVVAFQEKYAGEILATNNLTRGTGYVGKTTRAKLYALYGCVQTTENTLTISSGTQPANSIAFQGMQDVPFTKVTLKNNGSSAVTINNITIERTGLGNDMIFSGVGVGFAIDSFSLNGAYQSLNSYHQAVVGVPFTLLAGAITNLLVVGNITANVSSYAGQVVGLNVVSVNASVPVSGNLPISGALHTVSALSLSTTSTPVTLTSVTPTSGPVGTSVVLTGCGSDSTSGFTLIYAGPKSGSAVIPVETLSGGNSCGYMTFTVPSDFPAGTYTLTVKNNQTGVVSTNSMLFTVTGVAGTTQTGATTTIPVTSTVQWAGGEMVAGKCGAETLVLHGNNKSGFVTIARPLGENEMAPDECGPYITIWPSPAVPAWGSPPASGSGSWCSRVVIGGSYHLPWGSYRYDAGIGGSCVATKIGDGYVQYIGTAATATNINQLASALLAAEQILEAMLKLFR